LYAWMEQQRRTELSILLWLCSRLNYLLLSSLCSNSDKNKDIVFRAHGVP
jgi:hypothetical protein